VDAASIALVAIVSLTSAANALTVLNRGNGAEPKSLDPHFTDLIPNPTSSAIS